MDELDDFVVDVPYEPTEEELKAINKLKEKGLVSDDWDSGMNGIKSFKKHVREYMYYKQNFRCAYCRIQIPIACCFLQKEHIVPKSLHPKWLFLPINLCFVCDRCNNYKNNEEVLVKPDVAEYPIESDSYKIINPYIDKYSDHIKLEDDILYVAITNKGKFTIETCNLYRTELAIERAKKKMEKNNPDSVKFQLLSLLSRVETLDDSKENLVKKIGQIVEMYKNKNV